MFEPEQIGHTVFEKRALTKNKPVGMLRCDKMKLMNRILERVKESKIGYCKV